MVIDDFDIVGISSVPSKADAPLVIDADAVLAGAVALQRLQTVAGRNAQIVQSCRGIQLSQLLQRRALNVAGQLTSVSVCLSLKLTIIRSARYRV